jgi:hypothetical protein
MAAPFHGFDLSEFWDDSPYARKEYQDVPVTDELVAEIEAELGFVLPASYVALMRNRNGGCPRRSCVPTAEPTSWAEDHAAITGLSAIGRTARYSLCGELGSRFMQREWGYPEFGICIADCPSAGHDMVMLDYRECGPAGEPQVVHVDQEDDFRVTFLATDFEAFIRALVDEEVFSEAGDGGEDDAAARESHRQELRERVRISVAEGSFSPLLAELVADPARAWFGLSLRRIAAEILEEHGNCSLYDDEKSCLVYDLVFHLYTSAKSVTSSEEYLDAYHDILFLGDGPFSTGDYSPEFVEEWFEARRAAGDIIDSPSAGLRLSDAAVARLEAAL